MKIINHSKLKVYLLLPTFGKYVENALFFGRSGKKLQMDTGFTRLYSNEDRGDWIDFTILGFGLGFYWNFTEETW